MEQIGHIEDIWQIEQIRQIKTETNRRTIEKSNITTHRIKENIRQIGQTKQIRQIGQLGQI